MQKHLSFPFLIRTGLACVFLANSLTAFLDPGEFQDLLSHSFVSGLLPISVAAFVVCIGFNDLIVSMLLLSGWKTARVATYATLWLCGVMLVIGVISLDALEHLGFIAMAVSLAVRKVPTR